MTKKKMQQRITLLAATLDSHYTVWQRYSANESRSYEASYIKILYDGILQAIETMGGEWKLREDGKHLLYLFGMYADEPKEKVNAE